jgi:hypothetical protein
MRLDIKRKDLLRASTLSEGPFARATSSKMAQISAPLGLLASSAAARLGPHLGIGAGPRSLAAAQEPRMSDNGRALRAIALRLRSPRSLAPQSGIVARQRDVLRWGAPGEALALASVAGCLMHRRGAHHLRGWAPAAAPPVAEATVPVPKARRPYHPRARPSVQRASARECRSARTTARANERVSPSARAERTATRPTRATSYESNEGVGLKERGTT